MPESRLKAQLAANLGSRIGREVAADGLNVDFLLPAWRRLEAGLDSLPAERGLKLLLYSNRPEYFDRDAVVSFKGEGIEQIAFCSSEPALAALRATFDLALVCTHVRRDHLSQVFIRAMGLAPMVVTWAWDNHHSPFENLCDNALADLVLPAHGFAASTLRSPLHVLGPTVPLCTAQWAPGAAAQAVRTSLQQPRSDSLHGGYIMWEGSDRNEPLRLLQRTIPANRISLREDDDRQGYFGMSAEERLRDWTQCKVSLQVPLAGDVSLRIFDALLTGQIPIVPMSCRDLDAVIDPSLQQRLPVLRVDDLSAAAVMQAWQEGLRRFDEAGEAGVRARHEYAAEFHSFGSRMHRICTLLRRMKEHTEPNLSLDEFGIGLVANA